MKILNKPQILPCNCMHCGVTFQPTYKHLLPSRLVGKGSLVKCPFCKENVIVLFEKYGKQYVHYADILFDEIEAESKSETEINPS